MYVPRGEFVSFKLILQPGEGSTDSAGLEELVIDHREADRSLIHHYLGVATLGWDTGAQLAKTQFPVLLSLRPPVSSIHLA